MSDKIEMTCICCPIGCSLRVEKTDGTYIVTGNKCPRGKKYAVEEMIAPKRIICSTVAISGAAYPVIPVKTAEAIDKEKIFAVMQQLSNISIKAPVKVGDIVLKNVAETGVDIVATKNS